MNKLLALAGLLQAKWQLMSPSERFSASVNATVDGLLALLLVGMIFVENGIFFWMPFLAFVLFARWKQARQRWSL